jgi:hypothetical protein
MEKMLTMHDMAGTTVSIMITELILRVLIYQE